MLYLNYVLPIFTALLALLYLAKDWESHKKAWHRYMILVLIILVGIIGTINTYYTGEKTAKEADELRNELASTRKALNPPKARLTFTFSKANEDRPLQKITLPVNNDVVHVEFSVMNVTDVVAHNPELMLQICQTC